MTGTGKLEIPSPGTYTIDPDRSVVRYSGKHLFGTGTVHATFRVASGALEVGTPVSSSVVDVVVDASSFRSGSARRDKDVRGTQLLDVEAYPEIRFRSQSVREDENSLVLIGTVVAHGRTAAVEVVVDSLIVVGDTVEVHGRADHLDRYDFGITGSKGMVGRYLDLEVEAVASRSPANTVTNAATAPR